MRIPGILASLAVLLLGTELARADEWQRAKEIIAKTGAKLELVFSKSTYRVGEPIGLTMRYTCTSAAPPIQALVANYDRGGRIMEFAFKATRSDGTPVRNPLKFPIFGRGGLRHIAPLDPEHPYEQKVELNEWLPFAQPGDYEVSAESFIIMEKGPEGAWGQSVPLASVPTRLQIIAADATWQSEVLAGAEKHLSGSKDEVKAAMRSLRFLMDERAIPFLIAGLSDSQTAFDAYCGLLSLPDQAKVKTAVLRRLDSPPPPPSESGYYYANILSQADVASEGLDPGSPDEKIRNRVRDIHSHWRSYYTTKLLAQENHLSPPEMAAKLVDAMAIGGFTEATLDQKRLVLREAVNFKNNALLRAPYVVYQACDNKELIPELSALAANAKAGTKIRSAAMTRLHLLQVPAFRDTIAEDLMSTHPKLDSAAYRTLGKYRSTEIDAALLKNARNDDFEIRLEAANRIRDFGVSISSNDLLTLIRDLRAKNRFNSPELVEALALASPDAALPLLREILAGQVKSENDFRPIATTLIARLPNTRKEVLAELGADEPRRLRMLQELTQSAWYSPPPDSMRFYPSSSPGRIVPGDKKLAATYAEKLVQLATEDPSDAVRCSAANLLSVLSGMPSQRSGNIVPGQIAEFLPAWKQWAAENKN